MDRGGFFVIAFVVGFGGFGGLPNGIQVCIIYFISTTHHFVIRAWTPKAQH